jgi:glycosyltransferase involved in cell wall biosynthesis
VKIAFVVHDYRRREGHSRYVVELATRYAESHEVHVFANHIEADAGSPIHFHHVPAWRTSALGSILSFALQATLRVRGRFDIIHNQGLCGLRGNVFTAHIANRAWHRALRLASGRLTFREWVSGTTLSALEYIFYRTARKVQLIAVSKRIADDLRVGYAARAPITVVYHGVDSKSFIPARDNPQRNPVRSGIGLGAGEMAYLFVGDMRKGARQCLEALAKLRSGKLMFVSRSAEESYRALASTLGIEDRVVFLGSTGEVERYYAAADALLLPTHYDSFALVVTEAMATALPVVVSREAGASELIQDGVNGLLLDHYNDSAELAEKMRTIAEDQALAGRIGAAGRRTVEKYSWDLTAEETMRVYERLLPENMTVPAKGKEIRVL